MKKSRKLRNAEHVIDKAVELADDQYPESLLACVADNYDLYVNFDGGCWPNPGERATWGIVIANSRHETVVEASGIVRHGPPVTNNVAEYEAILQALRAVEDMAAPSWRVLIRGDSNLVIRQMKGQWKAKRGLYLDAHLEAKALLDHLKEKGILIDLCWIPREENEQADALTEAAYGWAETPAVENKPDWLVVQAGI